MTLERWQRLEQICHEALDREPVERAAYLDDACTGDTDLRRNVESLLAEHSAAEGFLETPSLRPGSRLDRYEVVAHIASGGMGDVYEARDTRLGRIVAIKVLPGLATDPRRRRFEHEARAASALNHPHICTLHDIGADGDVHFLVMERLDGHTLSERLRDGSLPLAQALDYAAQIAAALGAAHAHGIVHRDLKPANIMLTSTGAKLLDFGLAKLKPTGIGTAPGARGVDHDHTTTPGVVFGTLPYMAPEQLAGKETDARTDLFAFGCVLFEMLAGRRPFIGDSDAAIISGITSSHPPPVSSLQPGTPPAVDRVVDWCLQKDAHDRPESARDLADTLGRVASELRSALVRADPSWPGHTRRRVTAVLATVLVFVLAVAAIAIWRAVRRGQSEQHRQATIAELERLLDQGKFVDVWRTARPALQRWPGDPQLDRLLHDSTETVTMVTDPAGAAVAFKAFDDVKGPWIPLGTSPLKGVRAPLGVLRWQLTMQGFDTLEAKLWTLPALDAAPIRLRATGSDMAGMVFVPGGLESGIQLPDYWLDQTEVTNRAFKAFLDRAGYENPKHWTALEGGGARAATTFRDRTGQAGPATWELGAYPQGQEDYPVSGVSWFEAEAYCQAARKRLPTVYQWRRALGEIFYAELVSLSNFNGRGPEATGRLRDVGPYGTTGMAGNVKEWVWNESEGERYILGGAWNEPTYVADNDDARPPLDRSETNGFRCVKEIAPAPAAAYAPVAPPATLDPSKLKPVDAATFEIFRRFYSYDSTPLDARVESTQEFDQWRNERVSFAAAYGGERVSANVLLPKNATPPFQAVIFFPGSDATYLEHSDGGSAFSYYFDFLPRSGRVLVFPVYKGTYERSLTVHGASEYRDLVVAWSKDLGRTVDYLSSRNDIAKDKIAYYGFSMGSYGAVPAVALERRLKAVIFLSGGLANEPPLPEVDPVNFLPRITVPVLLMAGRYDFVNPVETSQKAYFALLGTAVENKKYVLFENAGHVPPRLEVIRESLSWLERYLGPVQHRMP